MYDICLPYKELYDNGACINGMFRRIDSALEWAFTWDDNETLRCNIVMPLVLKILEITLLLALLGHHYLKLFLIMLSPLVAVGILCIPKLEAYVLVESLGSWPMIWRCPYIGVIVMRFRSLISSRV